MKVLKFGGTSVGTAAAMGNLRDIVEGLSEPAVVVVSALGGVTDKLIETANLAASGDESYRERIAGLRGRHAAMIEEMVLPQYRDQTHAFATEMLGQLGDICRGLSLVGELTERSLSMIVAFGERISSRIVAGAIRGARHLDSLALIKTERRFGRNIADAPLTSQLLREGIGELKAGEPVVMGGFISRDRDTRQITNLGRGGSDYTAALAAAAIGADVLEIWTDVDGFMTADPRVIPGAKVLGELSFVESMELCSFGAKVIYPPTIYPVFERGIPIKILNTFNPTAPGTLISDHSSTQKQQQVHGLSSMKGCVLVQVKGESIAGMSDSNSRIFNTLGKRGVSVLLVNRRSPAATVSFAVRGSDGQAAVDELHHEFAPELTDGSVSAIDTHEGVEVVAVVGENIGDSFAIRSRIFNTLEDNGIPLLASAFGTSLTTVSFVTPAGMANQAIALLHHELVEN